ncbi:hypothetical protein [Methylacidiphilum caldifontis]|uniref:hypothetical protein n=1 Tax=Methylacidiphilum caldifontis TaxID=2795386 RepID=UPI001F5E129C|nr:hypothetical protein [Methylacidiphilum caldifontis]
MVYPSHSESNKEFSSLPLDEILKRAIYQNELMTKAMLALQYQEKVEIQKLDSSGNPLKTNSLQFLVKPGEGFLLSADPQTGTLAMRKLSTQDIQKAQAANMVSDYLSLKNLVPRFAISYEGMSRWHGLPSYIIRFDPKPNQPYQSKIEKLINAIQGKMWISKEDYSVLCVEGRLPKPVEMAWFIAVVDKLEIHYHASAEKGLFGHLPSFFDLEYRLKYILGQVHARQIISMKNFELPQPMGKNE